MTDKSQDIEQLISHLERDKSFLSSVTRWEKIAARRGDYADLPPGLHPALSAAIKKRGITRLYTHQALCYQHVRAGKNITVVTPTASGKTLCYNLPILQTLLEDPAAKALYLFPTKALSQDQQAELNEVVLSQDIPVKIYTYDGDTPSSVRVSARNAGRIVISNPDMLHAGILPNHPKWIKFLQNLRFVVIDEVHTYRGVFGSHMTNLMRRLKRILRFYNSKPLFICCSATIGNPLELSQAVIEEQAELVDKNGAPSGSKHLIFYNPPLVDPVQGIRRGVVHEAQKLAALFLKAGIKTIVFARSRVRTELIASYINKSLANVYTDNRRIRVEPYRGGYLPNERRTIEQGLRKGTVQGVVSTNALELGIDIGGLDAAILAGFPGSIASSWQQAGRAGRSATVSLAVIIASASPLNQYIINHPEYFLEKSPESGWINADNMYILLDHLKCAVFELPFKQSEGFPGPVTELLDYLEENGVVRRSAHSYYWADRSYPAEQISLRSATAENVVIINTTKGKHEVIGEMDRPSAKELLFDNAIYMHRGEQYVVTSLDIDNKRCYVEETDANYYTDSIVKTDIKLLHEDKRYHKANSALVVGDILVRTQTAKFKKLKFNTHENIGYGDIHLPEEEMHTRSVVVLFAENTPAGSAFRDLADTEKIPVIARLGYLIKNVAPVFLLCDPRDIGIAERLKDTHFACPCFYIYDSYPGGTGLSEGFTEHADSIFQAALERIELCVCKTGCPSCIGAVEETADYKIDAKQALHTFLTVWLKERK
ncbi:MAG: DEAD/DEAH box helicase [Spirochaetales bacterium]|nr:DEAD/DEAH box helicase [Spirochaetales bacterium]